MIEASGSPRWSISSFSRLTTVSQFSLTLRTSLLIREFQRLYGKQIKAWIGHTMPWNELAAVDDRRALLQLVHDAVFSLDPNPRRRRVGSAAITERY